MAVYTNISAGELENFLTGYNLGGLLSFEGIKQGVENTNYHIFTDKGRYILTIYEGRVNENDLPFFYAFKEHLKAKGIHVPIVVKNNNGKYTGRINGKAAAIKTFLEGNNISDDSLITPDYCSQMGEFLARVHIASMDFDTSRQNTMGIDEWKRLTDKVGNKADEIEKGLAAFITEEMEYLQQNIPQNLPKATIHADMFPDNVFFIGNRLYAAIDFYFSCTDSLLYDLCITANAWCFDESNRFSQERFDAFMESYESVRPLEPVEKKALPVMLRASCMRFLASRLHDWVFHDPSNIVVPKDPKIYIERLKFHRDNNISAETGKADTDRTEESAPAVLSG